MLSRINKSTDRRGAAAVETALVLPIVPPKVTEPLPLATVSVRLFALASSALIVPAKLKLLSKVRPSPSKETLFPRTIAPVPPAAPKRPKISAFGVDGDGVAQ